MRTEQDRRPDEDSAPVPYDEDAEAALLGAAMISKNARSILVTETETGDFYLPRHAHVSTVLRWAHENDHPVDTVTVSAELERRGLLETVGGTPALVSLMAGTPATTSAKRYAEIVHDHATRRRLLEAALEIRKLATSGVDAHDAVLRAGAYLADVAAQNGSRAYSTVEVGDVEAALAAGLEPVDADFLTRTDGLNLLYAGKMHVFQAEPSTGKTWLALQASAEVLELGGSVVYLDWEDTLHGILGRLLALGAHADSVRSRFKYAQPAGAFGAAERTVVADLLETMNPDLVVLDGVAEALARDGLSEDKASDVVTWGEKLPRWITRTGAAVVMLDHVAKDKESQGRWARGSGAKLAMIDGAAYVLRSTSGFSRVRSGGMRIVIAKDRPGGVGAIGDTAAMVSIEPHADGARVVVKVEPDNAAKRTSDPFRPTSLMARVSRELEEAKTPLTARAVRTLIHSDKPKFVSEAISRLIAEGYVRTAKQGSTEILILVKPFEGAGPPANLPDPDEAPELPLEAPDVPSDVVDLEEWKNNNF